MRSWQYTAITVIVIYVLVGAKLTPASV